MIPHDELVTLARTMVSRLEAQNMRGKKADSAVIEMFAGAIAAAEILDPSGKTANHWSMVATLLVQARGATYVRELAAKDIG